VLKTPPSQLFELAASRQQRIDVSNTATWFFPGSKSRILFVHGFRGDHHGLQAIIGALPDHTCVAPDLPGFGSTGPMATHDLASYGRWLHEFATETGPYDAIIGHSFGTLVVASAVSQGLNQVPVVLINPITTRASSQKSLANKLATAYYRAGQNRIIGNWLLSSGLVTRAMSIGLVKSKKLGVRRFVHDQHAKYFSSFSSAESVIQGFHTASTGSVMDYVQFLNSKTLLIAGEQDLVAPISAQYELEAALPEAELVVLAKVGHLTHYECAEEVAHSISRFLADK